MSCSAVEKKFYTVADLIAMGFGSRSTILRRIHDGTIPAMKDGQILLVLKDDFDAYVNAHRIKAVK